MLSLIRFKVSVASPTPALRRCSSAAQGPRQPASPRARSEPSVRSHPTPPARPARPERPRNRRSDQTPASPPPQIVTPPRPSTHPPRARERLVAPQRKPAPPVPVRRCRNRPSAARPRCDSLGTPVAWLRAAHPRPFDSLARRIPPPPRSGSPLSLVEGSHGDSAVLDRAFRGADAVFWLAPRDLKKTLDEAYVETGPAAEVDRRHGVKRVVSITALGRCTEWQDKAGLVSASIRMDDLLMETGAASRGSPCHRSWTMRFNRPNRSRRKA